MGISRNSFTQYPTNEQTNIPQDCIITQPTPVWPVPTNPPAKPLVESRPFPPGPLPPHTAVFSAINDNTELLVHADGEHKTLYTYVSSVVSTDIFNSSFALSGLLSTYTNNCINNLSTTVRYRGIIIHKDPNELYKTLINEIGTYAISRNDTEYINNYIKYKIQEDPEYSFCDDLRVGDLILMVESHDINTAGYTTLSTVNEYLCTKNFPLMSAKFERLGFDNIETIEDIISAVNVRIDKLGNVFNVKGYVYDKNKYIYPYEYPTLPLTTIEEIQARQKLISATRKGDVYLKKELDETISEYLYLGSISGTTSSEFALSTNWEKLGNAYATLVQVKQMIDTTSTYLYNYTSSQVAELSGAAHNEIETALISAKTYTDTEINNLSTIVLSGIISGFEGTLLYRGYICDNPEHQKLTPWECMSLTGDCESLQRKHVINNPHYGNVFVKNTEVSGRNDNGDLIILKTIQDYYMISLNHLNISQQELTLSTSYIKLNYTPELKDLATISYINDKDNFVLSSANEYTNNEINTLEVKAATSAVIAESNAKDYTLSTVNELEVKAAISAVIAETNAKIYADTILTGFTSSLISSLISAFNGTLIYKGYICDNPYCRRLTPWECLSYEHAGIIHTLKNPQYGNIYVKDTEIFGRNDNGDSISLGIIQDYYMINLLGNITNEELKLSTSYIKLNYTPELKDLTTINYVNTKMNNARVDLSAYVDAQASARINDTTQVRNDLSAYINSEISNRQADTAQVRNDLSAYINSEINNRQADTTQVRTDLSAYIDAQTNARINDTTQVRSDLSAYINDKVINVSALIYKGYICNCNDLAQKVEHDKQLPWNCLKIEGHSAATIDIKVGYTYTTNIQVDDEIEQVYHTYIGGDIYAASSYVKTGDTLVLTEYATDKELMKARIDLSSYINDVSSIIATDVHTISANLNKQIDNRKNAVSAARIDLSAYVDVLEVKTILSSAIASANVWQHADLASTNAYDLAKVYTDTASANVWQHADLASTNAYDLAKTYTDTISTNLVNYVDYSVIHASALIYKGYICNHPEDHTKFPWELFATDLHKDLISTVQIGYTYTTNIYVDDEIEQVYHTYIGGDKLSSISYIKTGDTLVLTEYATDKELMKARIDLSSYINDVSSIIATDVHTISTALNNQIKDRKNAITSTYNELSTYTDNQILSASTNLSGYINNISSIIAADVHIISTNLNTIIDVVSGENGLITKVNSLDNGTIILSAALTDYLSANAVTNKFNSISSQIKQNYTSAMIYKSYANLNTKTAYPWEEAIHISPVKYGDIFSVQTNNYIEFYMYIGNDNEESFMSSYIKLGDNIPVSTSIISLIGHEAICVSGDLSKTAYLTIDENDHILTQSINGLKAGITLSAITPISSTIAKSYALVGQDGIQLGTTTIDIEKDKFLSGAYYDETTKKLILVFYISDGSTISSVINLSGLIDTYYAGSGIIKDGMTFRGVIDGNSESYLTVNSNGFCLSGIKAGIDLASANSLAIATAYTNNEINKLEEKTVISASIISANIWEHADAASANALAMSKQYTGIASSIVRFYGYAGTTKTVAPWDAHILTITYGTIFSINTNEYVEYYMYLSGDSNISSNYIKVGEATKLNTYTTNIVFNQLSSKVDTITATISSNTGLITQVNTNTNKLDGIDTTVVNAIEVASSNLWKYTDITNTNVDTITATISGDNGLITQITTTTNNIDIITATISGTTGLITQVNISTNKLDGIDTTVVNAIESASGNLWNYTDKKVSELGKVFRFMGYAKSEDKTIAPWEVLTSVSSLQIGDVYLRDETVPDYPDVIETAEYVCISTSGTQVISSLFEKLGIKTSVDTWTTKAYVNQIVSEVSSTLEYKAAVSAITAESNANTYTDTKIITARTDLSTYVDTLESKAAVSAVTAETNAKAYTDSEVSTVTRFKGYAGSTPTVAPWDAHPVPSMRYGNIYSVDKDEYTEYYMYISGVTTSSGNYIKIGEATPVNTYATIENLNIVNNKVDILTATISGSNGIIDQISTNITNINNISAALSGYTEPCAISTEFNSINTIIGDQDGLSAIYTEIKALKERVLVLETENAYLKNAIPTLTTTLKTITEILPKE